LYDMEPRAGTGRQLKRRRRMASGATQIVLRFNDKVLVPPKTTFRSWFDGGRSVLPCCVAPPFAGPRVDGVAGFIALFLFVFS
jgi:hypothetical protein